MPSLDRPAVRLDVTHNQPITMRDGVVLRADVHRPADGEPRPTMLVRNPYGSGMVSGVPVLAAIDAGFAVVVQHCRGRGESDGEFSPWTDDPADGADTVRWITGQPWSDGSVVGWGLSYLAGTAIQTAIERPDGYRGLVAMQTPADFYDGLNYHGGAFALGSAQNWATLQGLLGGEHAMRAGVDAGPQLGAAFTALTDPGSARQALPLRTAADLPTAMPYWAEWLDHPTRDEYWQAFVTPRDNYDRIAVPAYHVAGWYDLFLAGTLENYSGLRDTGAPQVLVIGPWTHGGFGTSGAGESDYGPLSTFMLNRLQDDQFAFLAEICRDGAPAAGRAPIRVFVMGQNTWRDEQEWPLARTAWTPWYLQPGGGLGPVAPGPDGGASEFVADPDDPVPTVGGNLLFPEFNSAGPHDQRVLDGRADVLRFVSDPLDADLEVTGPLTVTLHAATDAVDTDFTAKLVDVHPDGRALNVADGIVRARFRNGTEKAEPITPGAVETYPIDLVATSQVFRAGHRIRVDVASANFPRFDRNPGNGTLSADATADDLTVQRQTVHHDARYPSHIVLPVIPG